MEGRAAPPDTRDAPAARYLSAPAITTTVPSIAARISSSRSTAASAARTASSRGRVAGGGREYGTAALIGAHRYVVCTSTRARRFILSNPRAVYRQRNPVFGSRRAERLAGQLPRPSAMSAPDPPRQSSSAIRIIARQSSVEASGARRAFPYRGEGHDERVFAPPRETGCQVQHLQLACVGEQNAPRSAAGPASSSSSLPGLSTPDSSSAVLPAVPTHTAPAGISACRCGRIVAHRPSAVCGRVRSTRIAENVPARVRQDPGHVHRADRCRLSKVPDLHLERSLSQPRAHLAPSARSFHPLSHDTAGQTE